MKKLISTISIFLILISSTFSGVFAYEKGETQNITGSIKSVGEKELVELLAKKGLTLDGVNYIFKQKGIGSKEIGLLKTGTSKEKKSILAKLTVGGLSSSTVGFLYSNGGFTSRGLDMVGRDGDFEISGDFLQRLNTPGSYKINFQDITSENAGGIIQKWTGKNSLPNEFVLEQGMKLKIDKDEYSKKLIKLEKVNQNKADLEKSGIVVGYGEPELRLLPDRVQVIEQVDLTYKSNTQLEKIKKEIYDGEDVTDFYSSLNLGAKDSKDDAVKKMFLGDESKAPNSTEKYEEDVIKGMIEECLKPEKEGGFGKSYSECSEEKIKEEIEKGEKTITVTEKIEFSIIPPTSVGGDFDLLKMNPEDVRISRTEILGIFNTYGTILQEQPELIEYPAEAVEAPEAEENIFTDDFCKKQHAGNQVKIDKCISLNNQKNRKTREIYTQNLLNGFTIGESHSYTFSDSIRVGVRKWKKTIARASISFYYSYGFGLRFPIQSKVIIEDSITDDYHGSNQDYKIAIGLKTSDADADYYEEVLSNDDHVYDGKEFVLEFSAGMSVSLRAIGVGTIIDEDIDLMSWIARLFKDKLVNDLGIPEDEIDDIIRTNKFDKGRHFTPPFAGSNTVPLLDVSTTVPVYSWAVLEVFIELILESYLDGKIKFECENVNSRGGCPARLEYNANNTSSTNELGINAGPYKWKNFDSTARYNSSDNQTDELGSYSNYGVILDAFEYIPTVVVDVFLRGGAKVYIPVYGWKTFKTDKIKIFSMEFDIESDLWGRHSGTNGTVDATGDNKIYTTTPDVEIVAPVIRLNPQPRLSSSKLELVGNTRDMTYNMYTISDYSRSLSTQESNSRNPYCENGAGGLPVNGERYNPYEIIWETPYNDAVYNKKFDIRARGCDSIGNMTEVVRRNITLVNTSFDIEVVDYPFRVPLNTNEKVEFDNDYIDSGDINIRYAIDNKFYDGFGGGICSKGELYNTNNQVSFGEVGKNRLENDFSINLYALACNSAGEYLENKDLSNGDNSGVSINIHNVEFNPTITTDGSIAHIDSYKYADRNFDTYYTYTLNGDIPDCGNDSHLVSEAYVNSNIVELSEDDSVVMFMQGQTIRARTCIKDRFGRLVFESDVINESTDPLHDRREYEFDQMEDRVRGAIDHRMMEDMFVGFDINYDSDLMLELNGLLDGGGITVEGMRGMNRLMVDGGLSHDGMLEFGRMKTFSNTQMAGGMRTMMKNGKMNNIGLSGITGMIKSGDLAMKGLTQLAGIYSDFGVEYVGINKDLDEKMNGKIDEKRESINKSKNTKQEEKKEIIQDQYVNNKLGELNECFIDTYQMHLENIENTIKIFENNRDKSKDEKSIKKYETAISKMKQIKQMYIKRYENIIEYSK